jgi:hypothetical protein
MKNSLTFVILIACFTSATAQVNSGSNGSDGAFNPMAATTVVDMADHPSGIYHYTSVNVPFGVTVTIIPNSNNTPIVWLVQSNVVIHGSVIVSGESGSGFNCGGIARGGRGGPGGWNGGNGGVVASTASSGQGPGGGQAATGNADKGANASYALAGTTNDNAVAAGATYGNRYLIPLLGGSGGGGATAYSGVGGGGGGGALLIAASGTISIDGFGGYIQANGGSSGCGSINCPGSAGAGSGGAVRLVAAKITGTGRIHANGGLGSGNGCNGRGGSGRTRFDTYQNDFAGEIAGDFSQGFQPIIIPAPGELPQLTVTSVGGIPVSASPTGVLSTPDAVISAQQNNPIPVVVRCSNLPLNSQITVTIKPVNGPAVTAIGVNSAGTLALSTATVSINIPRGGGLIYATAATAN